VRENASCGSRQPQSPTLERQNFEWCRAKAAKLPGFSPDGLARKLFQYSGDILGLTYKAKPPCFDRLSTIDVAAKETMRQSSESF
jgi:hypothetical protein